MNVCPEKPLANEAESPAKNPDWQDFREHLATADKQGNRRWLYPTKPKGRWYARRTYTSWLLLAIRIAGPLIRIDGNTDFLINIVERTLAIFGLLYWASDFVICVIGSLMFVTSIMVFTTPFGR